MTKEKYKFLVHTRNTCTKHKQVRGTQQNSFNPAARGLVRCQTVKQY